MTSRNRMYFLVFMIAIALTSGICYGLDNNFQWWSGTGLSTKLSENTKFTFLEEFRIEDDRGNLYRHHSDFGLKYISLLKNVDLGFNYMHIFQEDSDDEWREEHRPHLNLTVRGKLFGLSVADRSRLEFRDRENKDDVWRYRNRFTINRPFEFLDSEELDRLRERFKPYISNEVFFNCDGSGYARNRLCGGLIIKLLNNVAGDLYYLWQTDEADRGTRDTQVFGLKIIVSF